MVELILQIEAPDFDDPGRTAELTRGLRRELSELPFESIQPVKAGPAPDGARTTAEAVSWSALALALGKPALQDVFKLVQTWVNRQPARPKVTFTHGKTKLVIEGNPTPEQTRLVDAFIAAIGKDEEAKPAPNSLSPPRVERVVPPVPPEVRSRIPETLALLLPGGPEMTFQRIEAGEFRMGGMDAQAYDDEKPVHRVRTPTGFYLGTYPVTQAQFSAWTRAKNVRHANGFENCPNHPAESMDWNQANNFCEWLTQESRLKERGLLATLPPEAYWEYACRAGTETEYCSGNGKQALERVGWFAGNSGDHTHPVGEKEPNEWGLFDMHGNVWEWCADVWDAKAYEKRKDGWEARTWGVSDAGKDAEFYSSDSKKENPLRVLRGGSWDDTAGDCRSAVRIGIEPDDRGRLDGFRVCLVPGPKLAGAER